MFHSFGLTVTGLLPLFAGVRVVHHPDPTDAGRPGPQDRDLQADDPRRHADVHELHPRPREAGRPRLAAPHRRRRGEGPAVAVRQGEATRPARGGAGRLRHHRVLAGRRGEPARPREARHHRRAAAGRRGVRHRPGDEGRAAARANGDAARRGAERVPRLHRRRRPIAVRGDRREALVRDRRPGGARPDGRDRLPRPAEALPEGGRRDDLAAGAGGAVRQAVPADGRRPARGRGRNRDPRRPPHRAVHDRAHHAARRERAASSRKASAA